MEMIATGRLWALCPSQEAVELAEVPVVARLRVAARILPLAQVGNQPQETKVSDKLRSRSTKRASVNLMIVSKREARSHFKSVVEWNLLLKVKSLRMVRITTRHEA